MRRLYRGLLKCAHCGSSITAEIKKDRYIYYHCTFDKGNCGGGYVREEKLERQFEGIFDEFQFSENILDWVREALRQSQKEKTAFHNRTMKKLNDRHAKLQNRIDQIYLDKLDGEIEEVFYRRNVKQWLKEQNKILDSMQRLQKANESYIEQGINLLNLAQNASDFYKNRDQETRRALLDFMMSGSTLQDDAVIPVFKPPFDIIHRLAQEAQKAARGAYEAEDTRLLLLPGLDSNFRHGGLRRGDNRSQLVWICILFDARKTHVLCLFACCYR